MPTFLETVEVEFGSRDLYEVLGVERSAGEAELRRAYRRLSLRVHPDRVSPEQVDSATHKFQTLGKIYSVLTDKDKRAIYDEEGTVDEESSIFDQERDWTDYWRLLFPKITVDDIRSFEEKYKGSGEEREDLKKAYLRHEGDMDRIMEEVLCASVEDEPRYAELLQGWIAEGELPDFDKFSQEPERKKRKRKTKYRQEAREAKKAKLDTEDSNGDDLSAVIRARQSSREQGMGSFFDNLEKKYSSASGHSKNTSTTTSSSTAANSSSTGGTGNTTTRKGKSRRKK